jgi:hypothetical protein
MLTNAAVRTIVCNAQEADFANLQTRGDSIETTAQTSPSPVSIFLRSQPAFQTFAALANCNGPQM